AGRVPDRVAVTVDGEPTTHAELDADAGRVASWLAGRLRPGDRVLLAVGAGLGFLRCYLGSLRAGAGGGFAHPGWPRPAPPPPGPGLRRPGGLRRSGPRRAAAGAARAAADRGRPRVAARAAGQGRPADPCPAGRYRRARLHLGHDRAAEGRAPDAPPADHLGPRGDGGLAVEPR